MWPPQRTESSSSARAGVARVIANEPVTSATPQGRIAICRRYYRSSAFPTVESRLLLATAPPAGDAASAGYFSRLRLEKTSSAMVSFTFHFLRVMVVVSELLVWSIIFRVAGVQTSLSQV